MPVGAWPRLFKQVAFVRVSGPSNMPREFVCSAGPRLLRPVLAAHRLMADRDGQLSESGLPAGIQDAGHGLEVAAAIASDQNVRTLEIASGGAKGGGEFFWRYDPAVEHDGAVSEDIQHQAFVNGGQMAGLAHARNAKFDLAFHLGELGAGHKEDDEEEQHVDHRREIERWYLITVCFEGHGRPGRSTACGGSGSGSLLAHDLDVSTCRAGLQPFCGDQLHKLVAALIEFHGELIHPADEKQMQCQGRYGQA